ncbi:MAG TPA: CAP domain-containing protein [Anaerolineae bacterium]|nr:CAP domain-containing protein [Anaerolineae bacterium]
MSLINQERSSRGISPLIVSSQLTAAARQHSRDMACNDFFSHTGSDGSSPFDRMAWSGFSFTAAAENIYAGSGPYNSPQQAFNGWMNSTGHRTNMLNATYTHVGIGYIYCASSTYGGYFTANFARP